MSVDFFSFSFLEEASRNPALKEREYGTASRTDLFKCNLQVDAHSLSVSGIPSTIITISLFWGTN